MNHLSKKKLIGDIEQIPLVFLLFFFLLVLSLIQACGNNPGFELQIQATLDDVPVAEAQVLVNGVVYGITNEKGFFTKKIKKNPGQRIDIQVVAPNAKIKIKPWQTVFVVPSPDDAGGSKSLFEVAFHSRPTVMFIVTDGDRRVKGATIKFDNDIMGRTNPRGVLSVPLDSMKKQKINLSVKKIHYDSWRKNKVIQPGEEIKVVLRKHPVVVISALSEASNTRSGIRGVEVFIDGINVGKTNAKGQFVYRSKLRTRKQVRLRLESPGYTPSAWESVIDIDNDAKITRYAKKISNKGVRVAIFPFTTNSKNKAVKQAVLDAHNLFGDKLFSNNVFKKIPFSKLREILLTTKLTKERLNSRGWLDTTLVNYADMIVLGDIRALEDAYLVSINVLTPSGQVALDLSKKISNSANIVKLSKKIAMDVASRAAKQGVFFEKDRQRFEINLDGIIAKINEPDGISGKPPRGTPTKSAQQNTAPEKINKINDSPVSHDVLKPDSLFKVESNPSGAYVYLDNKIVGQTPIAGVTVNKGYHKIRISKGNGYRDWEKTLDFSKDLVDKTGENKVLLSLDILARGELAEDGGSIEAAISAYKNTKKDHPDYVEARHRLAQLYLVYKNDYQAAVSEFENVVAIPEINQLIWKQFAVVYTNLGQAYYKLADSMVKRNKRQAAQYYAKAIQSLQKAKQNARFFPSDAYDEVVHDTYYYMALSYQVLFEITQRSSIYPKANRAWQEYFDFFPEKLASNVQYSKLKSAARDHWDQLRASQ